MASRATLIRSFVLATGAILAVAVLVDPFAWSHDAPSGVEKTPLLAGDPRGTAAAAAPGAPSPQRRTPSGLLGTTAREVVARARRSPAKGIVVNAWASWCGSCKGDIPLLLALPKTFGADIEVVLVSVDEPETQPAAMEMLLGFKATLPSYVADEPLDTFKPGLNPRWPGMLPATFLFDHDGKLRYFWGGPVNEGDIVPLLRKYLAGDAIDGEATFGLAPGAVTR